MVTKPPKQPSAPAPKPAPQPEPSKAQVQPAKGKEPVDENARGKVVNKTEPAPKSAPTNPKKDYPPDFYDREYEIAKEMEKKKPLGEQLPGILDVAGIVLGGGRGRSRRGGKPGAKPTEEPVPPAKTPAPAPAPKAPPPPPPPAPPPVAAEVKAAGGSGGAYVKGKTKRRPSRRCELVPYNELECPPGNDKHHVVPDWMLRQGKRGGPERIPDMPSLDEGPAICLENGSGKEHNTAHKHTDRPAVRVGREGTATGTPGTITLGQAKKISARAIEKSTGGPKKGGCSRADIQKQLDEQFKAHNDAVLRAVKDARRVTDEIKNATNGGKDY